MIILFIAVILSVAYIFLSVYLYRQAFVRFRKSGKKSILKLDSVFLQKNNDGKSLKELADEGRQCLKKRSFIPVELKTFDGLTLRGKLYNSDGKTKGTVIVVHGYRSTKEADRPHYKELYIKMGFNVLEYDLRGHGASDGKYITYGILDRFDLRDWAYLIKEMNLNLPIVFDGISMGGATVCMASGLELPENVKLIVADCPMSNPYKQILYTEKKTLGFPLILSTNIIGLYMKFVSKTDIHCCRAENEIKKNKVPFLLIHGAKDNIVPMDGGLRIYENCNAEKRKLIVENANHGQSYPFNTDEYIKVLKEMLNKYVCSENPID